MRVYFKPPRRRRARGRKRAAHIAKMQRRSLVRAIWFVVPIAIALPVAIYLYGYGKVREEQQALALRPLSELRYEPGNVATSSMGEEFVLDGFRYRVTGAIPRGKVYGFQQATGRFVQVAIIAVNSGDAAANPADISIVRGDGTAYAELPQFSTDGTSYSQVLSHGVKPMSGGEYLALFDVASGSSDLWLSFHRRDGMSARIVSLGM